MNAFKHKIIKQYYELAPKPPNEISNLWKSGHVLLLAISSISGYIAAYTFGKILKEFDFKCILFASLVIDEEIKLPDLKAGDRIPLKKFSSWGSDPMCNFVQFTQVSSMIAGIIWIFLFIIYGHSIKVIIFDVVGRPWRLIIPFIIWTVIVILVMFGSNQVYGEGFRRFCGTHNESTEEHCLGVKSTTFVELFGENQGAYIYNYYIITKVVAYIGLVGWMANMLWTMMRIYFLVDFQIYLIHYIQYDKDPQENNESDKNSTSEKQNLKPIEEQEEKQDNI